jgi:hypothetical protein
MKLGKKSLILLLIVLFGSFFIGITSVQGAKQTISFEAFAYWDYTGFDPGTSFDTGNWAAHIIDNVNTFVFIAGPIEGYTVGSSIITNFNDKVGIGVGIGFGETFGTWIGDDEFNGLPIYFEATMTLRLAYGGYAYIGTTVGRGTLGDYSVQIRGEFITAWNPYYMMFGSLSSMEMTIFT